MGAIYLDYAGGSDLNDGRSFAQRIKTLTRARAIALPGDEVRMKGTPITLVGAASWTTMPAGTTRFNQPTRNIASSTFATPTVITTTAAHGYVTGDTVVVSSHTTNTNANGAWEITVLSPTTFSLDGSVGNGTGGAAGTVLRVTHQRVMLAAPVTQNIAVCGNRGQVPNWTAAVNVTASLAAAAGKEGGDHVTFVIAAGFTTGKVAHYTLPSPMDLNDYQQVSCWFRSGSSAVGSIYELWLCSDVSGDVPVRKMNLMVKGSNGWSMNTKDFGAPIGVGIASLSLHALSDPGSQTLYLDSIIACRASSDPTALTLGCIVGKNTVGDGWYPVQSINGRRVLFDRVSTANGIGTSRGYHGTTEVAPLYKIKPVELGLYTSDYEDMRFNWPVTLGSSLPGVTFTGGWNATDMSTRVDGELSAYDCYYQRNTVAGAVSIYNIPGGYVSGIMGVRSPTAGVVVNFGDTTYPDNPGTAGDLFAVDCISGGIAVASHKAIANINVTEIADSASAVSNSFTFSTTSHIFPVTEISLGNWYIHNAYQVVSGAYSTIPVVLDRLWCQGCDILTVNGSFGSGSRVRDFRFTQGNNVSQSTGMFSMLNGVIDSALFRDTMTYPSLNAMSIARIKRLEVDRVLAGTLGLEFGSEQVVDYLVVKNCASTVTTIISGGFNGVANRDTVILGGYTQGNLATATPVNIQHSNNGAATLFFRNFTWAETAEPNLTGAGFGNGGAVLTRVNHNGVLGDHRVTDPAMELRTSTAVTHNGRPTLQVLSYLTGGPFSSGGLSYRMTVANVAVRAGVQTTFKAWGRRSLAASAGGIRLAIWANQLRGLTSDIYAEVTAATDTWEELTLVVPPTLESGVLEIAVEVWKRFVSFASASTWVTIGYVGDFSVVPE